MSAATQTCPYCNAQFPAAEMRAICPRCRETLPGRDGAVTAAGAPAAAQRSNRVVVRRLLLLMAVMAVAGLALALWTISDRRRRDPKDPTPVVVTAPAELRTLGYLPGDTNVILGLHVAELLQAPNGRDLLTRFRLPVGNAGLDFIEGWTGVRMEDIDHVVIGMQTEWGGFPRTTILVQTRLPVDSKKVVSTLKGSGSNREAGRRYYPVRMPGIQLDSALWFTEDDYLLVLQAPEQELKSLPDAPRATIEHFSAPIQQLLRERGKGTQLWGIGRVEDWDKTFLPGLITFKVVPEQPAKLWMNVRDFGFWFQLGTDLQISARLEGKNAPGIEALAQTFEGFVKLSALLPGTGDMKAVTQELSKNLKTERKEAIYELHSKISGPILHKTFNPKEPGPDDKKPKD